jgi:hypothetical protein
MFELSLYALRKENHFNKSSIPDHCWKEIKTKQQNIVSDLLLIQWYGIFHLELRVFLGYVEIVKSIFKTKVILDFVTFIKDFEDNLHRFWCRKQQIWCCLFYIYIFKCHHFMTVLTPEKESTSLAKIHVNRERMYMWERYSPCLYIFFHPSSGIWKNFAQDKWHNWFHCVPSDITFHSFFIVLHYNVRSATWCVLLAFERFLNPQFIRQGSFLFFTYYS